MTAVVGDPRASGRVARAPVTVVISLVVVVALAVRWIGISLAPLAFQPHRQLTDATMARAYWFHLGGQLPANLPDGYSAWVPRALEPPVVQGAGAVLYAVAGHEALWLPRGLLALCWVVTALAVWGLVRRLVDRTAAAVAVGVWLFAPYTVAFSRSFLPDVLMLCLTMAALWAMIRDQELQSRRSWWLAGGLAAAAVFVKPTATLAVLPMLAAMAWLDGGARRTLSWRTVRRAFVVVAPAAAYWVLLTLTGHLQGQEDGRFDPSVLTTSSFWSGWLEMAGHVLPLPLVLLALVGLAMAPHRARAVGGALLAGYLAHGLTFSHHTPTHDYYHVLLIPPVVIGLGSIVSVAVDRMVDRGVGRVTSVLASVAVVALLLVVGPRPYDYVETALPAPLASLPAQAEAAGDFVGHAEPVLLVSRAYGIAQQYYGYLKGPFWPLEADLEMETADGVAAPSAEARLAGLGSPAQLRVWGVDHGPIQWVVVTEPLLLEQQPELATMLERDFEVVGSGEGWSAWHRRP